MTASSNNTVQIHTFPDGDPDGILTRFTTNATHVTFNSSGSRVAAGSRYEIQERTLPLELSVLISTDKPSDLFTDLKESWLLSSLWVSV